jgi:hypothetical protein
MFQDFPKDDRPPGRHIGAVSTRCPSTQARGDDHEERRQAVVPPLEKEISMNRQACAAILCTLIVSPAVAGPACDKSSQGTWVVRCEGELPGPGGLALTRLLGHCNVNRSNYWTCDANANLGGVRVQQTQQGQAQNNADCTGFITFQQTFNGFPGPSLDIDYAILDNGDEIWGLPRPVNPGEVLACTLKRVSK